MFRKARDRKKINPHEELTKLLTLKKPSYPKRPIRLRWLNISPPGIYSRIIYKFELSCKCHIISGSFNMQIWILCGILCLFKKKRIFFLNIWIEFCSIKKMSNMYPYNFKKEKAISSKRCIHSKWNLRSTNYECIIYFLNGSTYLLT